MIRTVGHGTLEADELAELLIGAGITAVVDVRRYPGSRKFPWFGHEELARWLPQHGLEYHLVGELGGRRRPDPDTPNRAWRNAQFGAYADHMASEEFARGIDRLRELEAGGVPAIMCSESLWWRCHRRLVADHLTLISGAPVEHLFHDGRLAPHPPMEAAVVVDAHVEYPADEAAEAEVDESASSA